MVEGPLWTKSKLTYPSNWHWIHWFSVIHLHTSDGATGLAQLLSFKRPKARILKGYLSLLLPY